MVAATAAIEGDVISTVIENLFQLSIVLSLPILRLYNGEKGGNKFTKWGFYIFYLAHLLIIALVKYTL